MPRVGARQNGSASTAAAPEDAPDCPEPAKDQRANDGDRGDGPAEGADRGDRQAVADRQDDEDPGGELRCHAPRVSGRGAGRPAAAGPNRESNDRWIEAYAGGCHALPMAGDVDAGRDEWQRSIRGWHLAFGLLAAVTGGLYLIEDGMSLAERVAALGILSFLFFWYTITGARVLQRGQSRLGLVYILLALPLTMTLFAIRPVGSLMLFALYPHIWALLPIRRAIVATAVAIGATTVITLARVGWAPGRLLEVFLPAAVGLAIATGIGVWISRIIDQSKQRAQLVAELAAARAELARVNREAGALAERERLARDIHDTLAQGFASVLLLLEAADAASDLAIARSHLDRARHHAQENLAEARALVAELTPPALRDASLPEALRHVVHRLGPELSLQPTLSITGSPRVLPADQEVVLLRVTQEALTNVRKHAAASRVDIDLSYGDGGVTLTVSDDGRGFDPQAATDGFGLAGMRDRVAEVGGALKLSAAPAAGASIRVELTS
jgi:signal transduction histidine kinase